MTFAVAEDVEVRLGREVSVPLRGLIEARLQDAERAIRRRIPDLDQKVLEGEIDAEDVAWVQCEAVLRLARNPEGYTAENDGNYGYELTTESFSGKLEILPDEWATLGIRRKLWVLVPTFEMPT